MKNLHIRHPTYIDNEGKEFRERFSDIPSALSRTAAKKSEKHVLKIFCSSHRTRRGRRLDFGYQRQFQRHMNRHGVGFQKISKLKKIYRGTLTSDFTKTSFLLRFT